MVDSLCVQINDCGPNAKLKAILAVKVGVWRECHPGIKLDARAMNQCYVATMAEFKLTAGMCIVKAAEDCGFTPLNRWVRLGGSDKQQQ